MQPHLINIQFVTKASISKLCLYMDYKSDESYTPKKLSVRSGTCTHDLVDLLTFDLTDPTGWVHIPLQHVPTANDAPCASEMGGEEDGVAHASSAPAPLRTFMLQIRVHSMHQNGRDTHIRLIKLFSPRQYGGKLLSGCSGELSGVTVPGLPSGYGGHSQQAPPRTVFKSSSLTGGGLDFGMSIR